MAQKKNYFSQSVRVYALLFTLLLGVAMLPKVRKLDSPDFKVFYVAAQHAIHDPVNLYKISPDRYLYPPTASLFFVPFAFSAEWHWQQYIWHILLCVMIFLLARRSWAHFVALFLLTRFLIVTLGYGQINLVLLALLAAAEASLKRGKEVKAGFLWAVATMTKVYPAVLGLLFLLQRRWRGLFSFVIAMLVFLALPFLFFGTSLALQLYGEFFQALQSKGLPLNSHNQSITALCHRLFTNEIFELHGVRYTSWGFWLLPEGLLKVLPLAIGLALVAVSWGRAHLTRSGYFSAAAFSILFLSHIVWKDYLLFLYFPLAEILAEPLRKSFLYGFAIFYLLLVTLTSPDIMGAGNAALFDAASIHLWGAILVWITWISCPYLCSLLPATKS